MADPSATGKRGDLHANSMEAISIQVMRGISGQQNAINATGLVAEYAMIALIRDRHQTPSLKRGRGNVGRPWSCPCGLMRRLTLALMEGKGVGPSVPRPKKAVL